MVGEAREGAGRWGALCLLPLLLAAGVAPAGAGDLAAPGCLVGGAAARVVGVSAGLELALDDGRTVKLPGVDALRATAAAPDVPQAARDALATWLVGRSVTVNPRAAEPDRWGRTLALVFATPPERPATDIDSPVSVGEAILDAGWARADPNASISPCWPAYRGLEARARSAGLGLWRDPFYAVMRADDGDGMKDRMGAMAIVEGQVLAVRPGRARTYVAFDRKGRSGFAATVERRVAAAWSRMGTDLASWVGRRVRLRGFLDDRFGPQIELTTLDQVEFIGP